MIYKSNNLFPNRFKVPSNSARSIASLLNRPSLKYTFDYKALSLGHIFLVLSLGIARLSLVNNLLAVSKINAKSKRALQSFRFQPHQGDQSCSRFSKAHTTLNIFLILQYLYFLTLSYSILNSPLLKLMLF